MKMLKKFLNKFKRSQKESTQKSTKSLIIKNKTIEYTLLRKNIKNLTMRISEKGLIVSAPFRATESYIENVLDTKSSWIEKKLDLIPSQLADKDLSNIDHIFIFNEPYQVCFEGSRSYIDFDNKKIFIKIRGNKKNNLIKKLKEFAMYYFEIRVDELSERVDKKIASISLTNAKSKWGSCSPHGHIKLNWRLIQAPKEIIDYVICHELAHLTHMNHSKKFWMLVQSIFPDYKTQERSLKTMSFKLHSLA
jgi:predicted metal-dependent hydrolase